MYKYTKMCRILEFWDTKFRFCKGKAWRFNKCTKTWKRIDNLVPDAHGYIIVGLSNNDRKVRSLKLHRLVYKSYNPKWDIEDSSMNNHIDHIDGNKLNNHIDNLRVVTHQENHFNRTKAKGYTFDKKGMNYRAYIKFNKLIHLGCYDTETDAREAYLEAKAKYHHITQKQILNF